LNNFEKYTNFKAGYITIIGRPNCGKSTLTNALLNFKLSIVTHKPQTTRQNILGILSGENYQIILMDTPGLLTPKYKLQETMVSAAKRAIQDADIILFMTEAIGDYREKDIKILKSLNFNSKPILLVINKIDLINKDALLPQIDYYHKNYKFQEIVPISALKRDGLDYLLKFCLEKLPNNPPFYPDNELSIYPERFFVAEIIREKIFMYFDQEIPYSTTVHIEEFKERGKGKDYVKAMIFIERANHRKILIGKNGQALKKIGQLAREEIEAFLSRPVYLELWVGVREKWRDDPRFLREFGYTG